MLGKNYFAEPNQHVLTFLHPKFAVQFRGGVVESRIQETTHPCINTTTKAMMQSKNLP
jgi:hypothetical protein